MHLELGCLPEAFSPLAATWDRWGQADPFVSRVVVRGGSTNGLTAWKDRKCNLLRNIESDRLAIIAQWPFCRLNPQ